MRNMLDLSGMEPVGPGLSGLSCARCGREFTHFEVSGLTRIPECPECQDLIDLAQLTLRPSLAGMSLLDDAVARSTSWYHLTYRRGWHAGVIEAQVPVYVGSKLAALTRAHAIAKRGERWWLHELQLARNITFAPGVEADSTDGDMITSFDELEEHFPGVDAVRYLNIYEDPGNIALLVDPNFVQVSSSMTLDQGQIRDHLRAAIEAREVLDLQLAR
jgi:hypothetical protein